MQALDHRGCKRSQIGDALYQALLAGNNADHPDDAATHTATPEYPESSMAELMARFRRQEDTLQRLAATVTGLFQTQHHMLEVIHRQFAGEGPVPVSTADISMAARATSAPCESSVAAIVPSQPFHDDMPRHSGAHMPTSGVPLDPPPSEDQMPANAANAHLDIIDHEPEDLHDDEEELYDEYTAAVYEWHHAGDEDDAGSFVPDEVLEDLEEDPDPGNMPSVLPQAPPMAAHHRRENVDHDEQGPGNMPSVAPQAPPMAVRRRWADADHDEHDDPHSLPFATRRQLFDQRHRPAPVVVNRVVDRVQNAFVPDDIGEIDLEELRQFLGG